MKLYYQQMALWKEKNDRGKLEVFSSSAEDKGYARFKGRLYRGEII